MSTTDRKYSGYVIAPVNPHGRYLGPFPDYETARAYAEKYCSDADVTIEPLIKSEIRS